MPRSHFLAALCFGCAACGHARHAAVPHHGKRPVALEDAGATRDAEPADDPFRGFNPADAAAPVPAYNAEPQAPSGEDDAGTSVSPSQARSCLELEPGQSLKLDEVLSGDRTWMRVDASGGCPAMHVTDRLVAYEAFSLCSMRQARVLTITMLGADRLPRDVDAVSDPLLAIYSDEALLRTDPFACMAVNDDAVFDGFLSNSSRIDGLRVEADAAIAIVATSAERIDQHGVGAFSLILSARAGL